jgi:hypothetical protein
MRETAFRVGRVDRRRQGVDDFPEMSCALAQSCGYAQKIYVLSLRIFDHPANRLQIHSH